MDVVTDWVVLMENLNAKSIVIRVRLAATIEIKESQQGFWEGSLGEIVIFASL